MNRSLAAAASATARFSSRPFSPSSMRAAASWPFSMIWLSSRSSAAVSRGTRPISFRYWPTESLITSWFSCQVRQALPVECNGCFRNLVPENPCDECHIPSGSESRHAGRAPEGGFRRRSEAPCIHRRGAPAHACAVVIDWVSADSRNRLSGGFDRARILDHLGGRRQPLFGRPRLAIRGIRSSSGGLRRHVRPSPHRSPGGGRQRSSRPRPRRGPLRRGQRPMAEVGGAPAHACGRSPGDGPSPRGRRARIGRVDHRDRPRGAVLHRRHHRRAGSTPPPAPSCSSSSAATWPSPSPRGSHHDELRTRVVVVVVDRPGAVGARPPEGWDWRLVPSPLVDLSSTDLRSRLEQGEPVRHLVPDSVIEVVRARHLYRSRVDDA